MSVRNQSAETGPRTVSLADEEGVKRISRDLSAMGCDIVTGGGPGLMQAANEGARRRRHRTGSEHRHPRRIAVRAGGQPLRRASELLHPPAPVRVDVGCPHCRAWRDRHGARVDDDLAVAAGAPPARGAAGLRRAYVERTGRPGEQRDAAPLFPTRDSGRHAHAARRGRHRPGDRYRGRTSRAPACDARAASPAGHSNRTMKEVRP